MRNNKNSDYQSKGETMGELSKLPNIGKIVEQQLMQAGIQTYDELKAFYQEKKK